MVVRDPVADLLGTRGNGTGRGHQQWTERLAHTWLTKGLGQERSSTKRVRHTDHDRLPERKPKGLLWLAMSPGSWLLGLAQRSVLPRRCTISLPEVERRKLPPSQADVRTMRPAWLRSRSISPEGGRARANEKAAAENLRPPNWRSADTPSSVLLRCHNRALWPGPPGSGTEPKMGLIPSPAWLPSPGWFSPRPGHAPRCL